MRFLFLLICFCSVAYTQTTRKTPPKTAQNLIEWKPVLPPHVYFSRPRNRKQDTKAQLPPPALAPLMVPRGTTNVARGKKVTSSDEFPIIGALAMITDGFKEGTEGNWVELGPNSQWVQIDLEKPCRIYGVHLWHYWGEPRVYRDVIVRIADDAAFTRNVRTLFNNDDDNSSKQGKGKDKEYYESRQGFLINSRGPKTAGQIARYVRLYSRGNTSDPQNQYIEVEVIGQPLPPPLPPMVDYHPELPPIPSQKAPPDVKAPVLPRIMVPRGVENLAYQKPIFSSGQPVFGDIEDVNDGYSEMWIALPEGLQWVQIDLMAPSRIYAIHLWHAFLSPHVYRDVVIQASNDRSFQKGVVTLFNNSRDKKSRFGIGSDQPYLETRNGLLLNTSGPDKQGITARYVRFWSNGNQVDKLNRYTEIKIIGTTDWVEAKFVLPPGQYQ